MQAPVLLSVDTELTWRHYEPGDCWRANFERSIEPAGVGLACQLETLARHRLKACFFVDPMPALLYGIEPIRQIVAPILAAGQEVQLHLHAQWQAVAEGRDPAGIELTSFGRAEQKRLIALGRDLLVAAGAPRPTAFRGGSYAANADTLAALAELGFIADSSHNGSHHPFPSDLPLPPRAIAPVRIGGLVELPVSQIGGRNGGLRHLQLCAVSTNEMRAALGHALADGHPLTTIVSHSFELATRDGRRVNALVRGRFESLCRLLDDRRDSHPTFSFDQLDSLRLGAAATLMPHRRRRTVRRFAEQLWAGARYERPVEAATATAGSSVQGLELLLPALGL
ncbi:MAG TPA: polysaccharide deacetylase [Allosphingosinicella sp.]|nr:polysaccharide deacetylase [Allosphingosinicella sp.]